MRGTLSECSYRGAKPCPLSRINYSVKDPENLHVIIRQLVNRTSTSFNPSDSQWMSVSNQYAASTLVKTLIYILVQGQIQSTAAVEVYCGSPFPCQLSGRMMEERAAR